MEFRVIWEIEIEATSPKEAAHEARAIQLTPGMSATVFDVWAHVAGKMHRIDLIDQPDGLDRDELFAVRAGLRLLQCNPDTPPSIQDVATVMLIFLDRDNMMFKEWIVERRGSEIIHEIIRGRQERLDARDYRSDPAALLALSSLPYLLYWLLWLVTGRGLPPKSKEQGLGFEGGWHRSHRRRAIQGHRVLMDAMTTTADPFLEPTNPASLTP